ncbi:MAG: ribonuclease III [Clostridia bacterium]|nr:ribonuclease III [Clostridia bacterium]
MKEKADDRMNEELLAACEQSIGYVFKNKKLLETALTHTSYANEHHTDSYQRLEFLGDSVVSVVVSTDIYNAFEDFPEGKLTKLRADLVREETLAELALRISIDKYIRLGVGESRQGGNKKPSILSDVFESIVGAVYMDGGPEAAINYVKSKMAGEVEKHLKTFMETDRKTNLQEYAASHGAKEQYEIIGEEGPDHDKKYIYRVTLDGKTAEGKGKTKQDAEQAAAKEYYEKYIENGEKKC